MAADYLMASLQPLALDGKAPYTQADFLLQCATQLGTKCAIDIHYVMQRVAGITTDETAYPTENISVYARTWIDLESQLRNALAKARAAHLHRESSINLHTVTGCSLFWANRIVTAYQEKDIFTRDHALDQVWWDAAAELTPVASPLSLAAVYTYAIRLQIILKREAIQSSQGNTIFDQLTASSRISF